VEERGEATVLVPGELAVPEAPGRRAQAPRIEVTPVVTSGSANRRTSPLQLEEAEQGPGLPEAPGPEELGPAGQQEDQPGPQGAGAEAGPVQEPEEPFLQPLVPAAPVRGRAGGRAAARPVVDANIQLGGAVIKRNMQEGWRASLRTDQPAQDLLVAAPSPEAARGDRLAARLRELVRRGPARQQAWDWEDQAGGLVPEVPVEVEGPEAPVEGERQAVPVEASMAGNMTATSLGREGSDVGDSTAAKEGIAAGAGTSGLQLPEQEPALDMTPGLTEGVQPALDITPGPTEGVQHHSMEAEAEGAVNYGGINNGGIETEDEGARKQSEARRAAAEGPKVSMDALLVSWAFGLDLVSPLLPRRWWGRPVAARTKLAPSGSCARLAPRTARSPPSPSTRSSRRRSWAS
jgi:hypothetical protein